MKLFFLFLFIILTINLASASLNLDKGKMEYNLKTGEEVCQIISLTSDDYEGTIEVRDVWAENSNEEGNLNDYIFSASDHQLSVKYIDTALDFKDSMDFEVCLSADQAGSFKGGLIFTPDAKTNVVVEVGTWLLINVEEAPVENPTTTPSTTSSGSGENGGGGGGGSSGGLITKNNKTKSISSNEELQNNKSNENNQTEEENSKTGITGAVTGLLGKRSTKIVLLTIIILSISYLIIYKKRKKENV